MSGTWQPWPAFHSGTRMPAATREDSDCQTRAVRAIAGEVLLEQEEPAPLTAGALLEGLLRKVLPQGVGLFEEPTRRYTHADLPDMTAGQLWRERRRVEFALTWLNDDDDAMPWLIERLKAVDLAQKRVGHGPS
jgi:hypothetical protein